MVTYRNSKSCPEGLGPVLKAIADPNRRNILDLLTKQDLPVGRIADQFRISRPAVVRHLRILRLANLLSVRRIGRERIQCLNTKPLESVEVWLSRYQAFADNSWHTLKPHVEENL